MKEKSAIETVANLFITGLLTIIAFICLSASSYSLLIIGSISQFLIGLGIGLGCLFLLVGHLNYPVVQFELWKRKKDSSREDQ